MMFLLKTKEWGVVAEKGYGISHLCSFPIDLFNLSKVMFLLKNMEEGDMVAKLLWC